MYFVAVRLQKLEEYDYPVFDQHFGIYPGFLRTRNAACRTNSALLAPTLPLRSISMALSGTDMIQHVKFMTDAETYRRNMVVKMNDYLSKAAVGLNASFQLEQLHGGRRRSFRDHSAVRIRASDSGGLHVR